MKAFDKLNQTFNTSFDPEEGSKLAIVDNIDDENNLEEDDVTEENEEIIKIDQEAFIRTSLVKAITGIQGAMDIFNDELKTGQKAYAFESYANMTKILVESIKELKELGQTKVNNRMSLKRLNENTKTNARRLSIAEKKATNPLLPGGGGLTQNNIMVLDSSDVLDMIIDARKKSSINEVKADFEINEKTV